MRLSKRDMLYVNRNTPTVFAVSEDIPKAETLTISFNNFDKLTPTDRKALTGEIFDMVNGRIQEYLQKTKSKTTSKESASWLLVFPDVEQRYEWLKQLPLDLLMAMSFHKV